MKIYGYQRDSDILLDLQEASLQCTIEELDKVINFLSDVRREHAVMSKKAVMCHSHLRDWDITWTKEEPDIVVVTKFNA